MIHRLIFVCRSDMHVCYFWLVYFTIQLKMDLNIRINQIEECSTNYVHQAEKFQADASHVRSTDIP